MTKCNVCGAELTEVERFTITAQDMDEHARQHVGRPLRSSELARLLDYMGDGTEWRQLACPTDPRHTGFLIERVSAD